MPRRLVVLLLVVLSGLAAGAAQARCTGSDLRDRLTPQAEARLEREVARTPFAEGNHWIARRGDRQLHVVGTMHDGDARLAPVVRRLRPAITGADAVLLEVTSAAAESYFAGLWRDPSVFFLQSPPYLDKMLDPAAWEVLALHMRDFGFEPAVVARMQPWFAGFFLGEGRCGGGLFGSAGLDDRIEKIARQNRVPIGSLEPTGAGLKALSRQRLADQVRLLELDLTTQMSLDDIDVTLIESYFDERLAEGMAVQDWLIYSDLPVSRTEVDRLLAQFNRHLLDERNRAWVKVIERTPGPDLVIAVGAAHLPGKAGLLNLLKARGYSLERAEF